MKSYGTNRNDIMIDALTVKAVWNGGRYDCISGSVDFAVREFSETVISQARRTARFWKEDFADGFPEIGNIMIIEETEYRILDIHDFSPYVKFALGDKYARE